jgi:ureidoglycolate lyase
MELTAEPLTAPAFAPFGAVLEGPPDPGRHYFDAQLMNRRPASRTSLSISRHLPLERLPLHAKLFERHEFSSQTFLPLSVARYLVIVAPAAAGGPDAARTRAFVGRAGQGVSYHAGTWHHGMTVLDAPAVFSVLMWRDGTSGDEEFVELPTPLTVHV